MVTKRIRGLQQRWRWQGRRSEDCNRDGDGKEGDPRIRDDDGLKQIAMVRKGFQGAEVDVSELGSEKQIDRGGGLEQ
jgi:hypothetical protein